LLVAADSTEEIISITAAGAAAGNVAVAVAPTINVLSETTSASIGDQADLTVQDGAQTGGDVVVRASDETDIVSVAGSIGVAGTVGVAVGADVLTLNKNTSAYIDSGVMADVDGDIDVNAQTDEDITSVAAGLAGGGTVGVGVNASVHVLTLSTRAFIGDDPEDDVLLTPSTLSAGAGDVHARGTVRIAADDRTEMDKVVATVAVGGTVGVGASATVSVVNKTTEAFIGTGAKVTGDGHGAGLAAATGSFGVSYTADPVVPKASFNASAVNTGTDTVNIGGASGLVNGDLVVYRQGQGESNAAIGGLRNGDKYFVRIDSGQASFYNSKEDALANANRINLEAGAAGNGHAIERIDVLEAQGAQKQSASALQGGGEVDSPSVSAVDTNGDAAGGSADVAATGQRNLTLNTSTVRGVAISATSRDDIETYSAAVAGGGTVGVAVAAAVNVIDVQTHAYVGAGALVNSDPTDAAAEQTVAVGAGSDFSHVALAAGAALGGAVGVAPGVESRC
jgi:hypothetical protein